MKPLEYLKHHITHDRVILNTLIFTGLSEHELICLEAIWIWSTSKQNIDKEFNSKDLIPVLQILSTNCEYIESNKRNGLCKTLCDKGYIHALYSQPHAKGVITYYQFNREEFTTLLEVMGTLHDLEYRKFNLWGFITEKFSTRKNMPLKKRIKVFLAKLKREAKKQKHPSKLSQHKYKAKRKKTIKRKIKNAIPKRTPGRKRKLPKKD